MTSKHLGTLCSVFRNFGVDIKPLTTKWLEVFRKEELNRGRQTAIKYMKELNTIGERFALHQPITQLPFRKSDKEGLPKDLYPFRKYLRGTIPERIAALSVLRTVEMLRLPISKDISTVTEPCSFQQDFVDRFSNFSVEWVKRLNLIKKLKLPKMKYHFTLRKGPNGPALASSDSDVGAIMSDPKLYGAIQKVQSELNDNLPLDEHFRAKPGGIHSKLTQFPEKAGKTRTIAVVDYYSQRALRPLHRGLMGILRSLVSDGTYSHRNVGEYAQQKTKDKSFIACYDLSAFTDRFPREPQRSLLFALFNSNPELASAFWTLLAERQFTVAWSGEKVSYSCGQPMGAYSSWALCSLAHHMLVEYSGLGIKNVKSKYRLIGDDLIITDKVMAQNYERNVNALGVDINFSKTVKSQASADCSAAEIAKQLFLNGESISPVTPGLIRSLMNPMMTLSSLRELTFKMNIRPTELSPELLKRLLPKKKSLETALVLISNPICGLVLPNEWDNTKLVELLEPYLQKWNSVDVDDVKQRFYDMYYPEIEDRVANLFANSNVYEDVSDGTVWQLAASPSDAQKHCASELFSTIEQIEEKVIDLMYKGFEESPGNLYDELREIEYLPDPKNPFQDTKERREILRAQKLIKVFKSL